MNSVSGESHTPNHVMQTSLGRPSPSRVEIAVRVAGLVLAGLTSIPMIAHAASINVPCQLAQLINAISGAVDGDVLSLADGCIYVFPLPMTQTSFLATMGFRHLVSNPPLGDFDPLIRDSLGRSSTMTSIRFHTINAGKGDTIRLSAEFGSDQ